MRLSDGSAAWGTRAQRPPHCQLHPSHSSVPPCTPAPAHHPCHQPTKHSHAMQEFAAGKQLLSGEYILPSGTALPFGAMISKLKRSQIMGDVMQGGEARFK